MQRSTATTIKALLKPLAECSVPEWQQLLSLRNWTPSISSTSHFSPQPAQRGWASWAAADDVSDDGEEKNSNDGRFTPGPLRKNGMPVSATSTRPSSSSYPNRGGAPSTTRKHVPRNGYNGGGGGGGNARSNNNVRRTGPPFPSSPSNNSGGGGGGGGFVRNNNNNDRRSWPSTNNNTGRSHQPPRSTNANNTNTNRNGPMPASPQRRPQPPHRPPSSNPNTYRSRPPPFINSNNNNTNFLPRRKPAIRPIPWWERNKVQEEAAAAQAAAQQRQEAQTRAQARRLAARVPQAIVIPHDATVTKLAHLFNVSVKEVERVLTELGDPARSEEDVVPPDAAELAALELGIDAVLDTSAPVRTAKRKSTTKDNNSPQASGDTRAVPRPAVVTVMGHVDHGKTTLLDALRETSVAAREAGGITQHVGAFEVRMPGSGQSLTFLDTPGHAAFSAMRARGAAVTDLVVLVVAADDGVMPQTKEALAHAQAAGCPIVVAITKCDVPGADPEKVRRQLAVAGVLLEGVGGTVQSIEVAAPTGQGLRELEEALLLEGEMLELSADPEVPATATVIEARLDRGQGPLATVIVSKGTLRAGQVIVVGSEWGKIRGLRRPGSGKESLSGANKHGGDGGVGPGLPVEVVGLRGVPQAGDELMVVASEERAQRVSRARTDRSEDARRSGLALTNAPPTTTASDGSITRVMPVVIKADVQGSAEAVRDALSNLSTREVRVHVIHSGVGPVTLSDVSLAVPSGAKVIGFNVKVGADAEAEAKLHGITVLHRRVIYEVLGDVGTLIEGMTPRELQDVVIGSAEVLMTFQVSAVGASSKEKKTVAGCRVGEGAMKSGMRVRVVRGGDVIGEGVCNSLRRHKLDVDTVGQGTECGLGVEGFDTFMAGDVLQCIDRQ